MNGRDVRYKRSSGVGSKYLYGIDGLYRHPNQHHKGQGKTSYNILGILYCTFFKSCSNGVFEPHRVLQNEGEYNPHCKLFFYLHNEINYKLIPEWKFREVGNFINGNSNWAVKKGK